MIRRLIVSCFLCLCSLATYSQIVKTKLIDNGGNGPYKAIAVSEKTLPDFVVYRPENLKKAVKKEGTLPILVFANGACANTSITHEKVLSEIASHGYIVVAIGALKMSNDENWASTEAQMLVDAMDWVVNQNENESGDYYQRLDLSKIAAGGQSCGGAQVMAVAGDARIKTYMMFNSGMGDMTMAGASTESLALVHGSVIYIVGGEEDIATNNARLDYERINHVPVTFANMLDGNHGGTFNEQYGGAFARMALHWLDWQLKGAADQSAVFLESDLSDFKNWSMDTKNFTN
ncbi:poly(ethylene terephthalate) hydrolase family protein [Reichenbachiella ulvae]|uniref:Alpha/beta hydrolase n=1 Tax=Reichenbachiella ulvae TaxID=2980104 RepID=A0ABT3CUU1_9BACT|nr:alpha/beta hydrolase [Reichenbachiella ulvae]MCV9387367.1 alpha/beta hydrolase [Reichenbachiella ulvae]